MIREDDINLLSYSVKENNSIIVRAKDSEGEIHTINEVHSNALGLEIGVFADGNL